MTLTFLLENIQFPECHNRYIPVHVMSAQWYFLVLVEGTHNLRRCRCISMLAMQINNGSKLLHENSTVKGSKGQWAKTLCTWYKVYT